MFKEDKMSKLKGALNGAKKKKSLLNTNVPEKRSTPNEWIEAWFSSNRLSFSHDGNHSFIDIDGNKKNLNIKTLTDVLITDSFSIRDSDVKKVIGSYLSTWITREEQRAREQVIKKLSFDESMAQLNHIESFIIACTGRSDEVDIAVIKHFIWSVKRKMKGLDVTRHLFTIFQGGQNAGKSTAVKKLISPVHLFSSSRALDMLNDSKELFVLTNKCVIWFDEMSRASRADVEAIKLYTTSDTVSYRILYSQNEATSKNIATFIGCTNKSVDEIVYDPTGARRFYELKCLPMLDHALVNSINYEEMWKSVNEYDDVSPLEPLIEKLTEKQKSLRAMDTVEEFLHEESLIPDENGKRMEVSFNDLYSQYVKWMTDQKRNALFTKAKFSKRLNALEIENSRKSDARTRILRYNQTYESLII